MTDPIEPLDPDVATLLAAAKRVEPPSLEVRSRVEAAFALHAGLPKTLTGPLAKSPTATAVGRLSRGAWRVGAVGFGLGMGLGIGMTLLARPAPHPVERIVYVERSSPPVVSPAPAQPQPEDSESPTAIPDVPRRPSSSGDQLAAESALLDVARIAVARGEGDKAMQAIQRHRAQFPAGQLSEEREALTVKSLHLLGRDDEAKVRFAQFERSYPGSLFLPALRDLLSNGASTSPSLREE